MPVTRKYPNAEKVPTKISFLGGNTNLLKILFANLFGVALNTVAQLCLKQGMQSVGGISLDVSGIIAMLENVYANLYILGGMTCYVLSFVVWLVVLSRVEVSVAYPMLIAGYILTAFAGWYFWGEALTMNKFLGIGLICFGVLFMFKN